MVRRIGMKLALLAVLGGLVLAAAPSAWAIKQTFLYFSATSGIQDTARVAPGIEIGRAHV